MLCFAATQAKGFKACYSKMTVSYTQHAPGGQAGDEAWGYVHFTRGLPRSLTCDDMYGVSSKFGSKTLDISVAHSIIKKMHINYTYAPHEFEDIKKNGLSINVAPCGLAGTVTSALATAALFAGKNVEDANKKFLIQVRKQMRGVCLLLYVCTRVCVRACACACTYIYIYTAVCVS